MSTVYDQINANVLDIHCLYFSSTYILSTLHELYIFIECVKHPKISNFGTLHSGIKNDNLEFEML